MPTTTAQKLKIKEGSTLLTINAPKEFKTDIGELPGNVKISSTAKTYHQIHWFVNDKAQMEEEVESVIGLLKENVICWIYYPKGSSKIQTDLTRDKGWESLLKHKELQWLSLISFNDTWSAFAMRLKTEADKKKEAAPKERPIFQYIDPVKKLVFLPDDLTAALKSAPKEKAYFDSLAFSHKKEYVEWIVSAKKQETRRSRIASMIERLQKGWRNPANQG